jgi:hypothetical protein
MSAFGGIADHIFDSQRFLQMTRSGHSRQVLLHGSALMYLSSIDQKLIGTWLQR